MTRPSCVMCDDDGREQGRLRLCSFPRSSRSSLLLRSSVGPLYNRLFAHWKLSEGRNGGQESGITRLRCLGVWRPPYLLSTEFESGE